MASEPKSDLLAWVRERARDADDVRAGSKLIAAFVAESVRADRAKHERSQATVEDFAQRIARIQREFEKLGHAGTATPTEAPRP